MNAGKKVFVGMSGGVDSSVSAALLVEQGYDVTGVFIKAWHPDFIECSWREDRQDAMAVCAQLGIPFETCDLEEEYKRDVVDYLVREYAAGRTPNPDVMCNQQIKFGAFYRWARERGADFVATGHYARTTMDNGQWTSQQVASGGALFAGVDTNKDQSYFLWAVDKETLAHVMFPIGGMTKPEVREEAARRGLPVATKKDSQGICFLGHVSMEDFLKRFIDIETGDVLDESGKVIGRHEGALIYTLGQRHGFDVTDRRPTDGAFYVVSKDIAANTITVSQEGKTAERFAVSEVTINQLNWIGSVPEADKTYMCRFRYRQQLVACTVTVEDEGARVVFIEPQLAVSPGQSLVVYDGDECVGGGIIK